MSYGNLSVAKERRQLYCFLRESEASAADVFLRESEASAADVFLRESEASAADVFLRESEASAANVFCAKAKRQRQMFSARKQSVSAKASYNQALEDYEKLDVDLQQQANVSYRQTKRGSVDSIVLSNDMKNHRIIWEENIGVINAEQKNPAGSYFKELLCH